MTFTLMHRIQATSLAFWLAIAAFLAGNCLGPRGVLHCADASGSSRFELGCPGDFGGGCHSPELAESQCQADVVDVSAPCTDTQLRSGDVKAQSSSRTDLAPPALILAELPGPASALLVSAVSQLAVADRHSPPESQEHLRSVVLVI